VTDADRSVLALATARAADAFGNSFLIVVLPLYIANAVQGDLFGLPAAAAIGIVLSVLGIVNSLVQPFVGRASDLLARRRVFVLAGLATLAASNLAYIWADGYAWLVGLRVVQGLAFALTIPCTLALVSELATEGSRGAYMGLYNTFRLTGYGIGPVVAGFVVHHGPYRWADASVSGYHASFLIASLAALGGFLFVAALVRDPGDLTVPARRDVAFRVRAPEPRSGLDPVFVLGLATFFAAISISLIGSIENEINARLAQTSAMFGLQFSVFLLPHVLLQTPIGRLSDRWGRKRFVVWGTLFTVPATLVQGFVTGPWQMLGARALQGLTTALFFSPGLAMAGDLSGEGASGSNLSVLTMAFGLGVAIGPLMAGFLVTYGFAVPFVVGGTLCALAAGLTGTQLHETLPDATLEPASPDPSAPVGAAEQPDEVGRTEDRGDQA
jgi:MFS family permease